jgi:hypothetical protein
VTWQGKSRAPRHPQVVRRGPPGAAASGAPPGPAAHWPAGTGPVATPQWHGCRPPAGRPSGSGSPGIRAAVQGPTRPGRPNRARALLARNRRPARGSPAGGCSMAMRRPVQVWGTLQRSTGHWVGRNEETLRQLAGPSSVLQPVVAQRPSRATDDTPRRRPALRCRWHIGRPAAGRRRLAEDALHGGAKLIRGAEHHAASTGAADVRGQRARAAIRHELREIRASARADRPTYTRRSRTAQCAAARAGEHDRGAAGRRR